MPSGFASGGRLASLVAGLQHRVCEALRERQPVLLGQLSRQGARHVAVDGGEQTRRRLEQRGL